MMGKPECRVIRQADLTSECWLVQFRGGAACETCELCDTEDCGGVAIRESGKNAKGKRVPLSEPTV